MIITDEESLSPSSRTEVSVTVATYHGVILKEDQLTFYISHNNPEDIQETELKISKCDLLEKLENFHQGFRLCAGLEVSTGLDVQNVFIEPFGESRDEFVIIRSRKCEYLLELEDLYSTDKIDLDRVSCIQCGLLQNKALCIKTEAQHQYSDHEFQMHEELLEEAYHDDDIKENIIDDKDDPAWTSKTPISKNKIAKSGSTRQTQRPKKFDDSFLTDDLPKTPMKSTPKKRRKRVLMREKPKRQKSETVQQCAICFKEFAMLTRYDQHMELHKKRIKQFSVEAKCPKEGCDLNFGDRESLCKHYTSQHDQDSTPCAYCLKVIYRDKIRAHFFAEHPYKEFSCQICGKICAFQSQLKQHTVGEYLTDFFFQF